MNDRIDIAANYRYFRIGKFLVCLDQSLPVVINTIGLGHKRYQLGSLGVTKAVRRVAIRAVIKDRLRLLDSSKIVELPVFGHIGMQVHRGCKVFDFSRGEVTKVFATDSSPEDVKAETAASKLASQVSAAPRFVSQDPGFAWYREEYVCGVHATDPGCREGAEIADFYPEAERCLLDLVACQSPRKVDTDGHFMRLADSSFRDCWLSANLDAYAVEKVFDYVEHLRAWLLHRNGPDNLLLVLTHGDFSLVNTISTSEGLRFIDWEGVALGGLYSDIFNFLFVEQYYGRASTTFMEEFLALVERYRTASQERFPELREAAETDALFARRQYYLERLSLLLDRKPSENLCKVVSKSIDMFREYDREAGDGDV